MYNFLFFCIVKKSAPPPIFSTKNISSDEVKIIFCLFLFSFQYWNVFKSYIFLGKKPVFSKIWTLFFFFIVSHLSLEKKKNSSLLTWEEHGRWEGWSKRPKIWIHHHTVQPQHKGAFTKAMWKPATVEAFSSILIFIHIRSLNRVTAQTRMGKYLKIIHSSK